MKFDETEKAVIFWAFIAIGVVLFFAFRNNKNSCVISYYARFESGDIVRVDNIIAVPVLSAEQVSKMWPEYYAETMIVIEGKKIILRSEPFLFCDEPEMEGRYTGRAVYCSD